MPENIEIGKRIEARRKELDLTLLDISSSIGVAASTIQRYEKGQFSRIKLPIIEAIASVLHVNPEWIIGHTDDPIDYDDGDFVASIPSSYIKGCDGDLKMAFDVSKAVDKDHEFEMRSRIIPIREMHSAPILGKIRAGYGLTAVENIVGYMPTEHVNYEDCFWLKVEGRSMEPRIFEGDYVLVDKEAEIENGDIVAVIVDGEDGTVKKYEKQENAIILKPLNSACETRVFVGKEQEEIFVVGRVVEIKAVL